MKRRTLILIGVGLLCLCILALVSETLFTDTHTPEDDGIEIVTDEATTNPPEEKSLEEESESQTTEVAETKTETQTEAETTEKQTDMTEETEESEVEETIKQAELPEVRKNIQIYGDTGSNSYWDIQIYGTFEEAYDNLYSITYTGKNRFCIEGFEQASSVTSQIVMQDDTVSFPTSESFCEGIYSFEGNFEPGEYIVELSYVVGDTQDTVYMGVKFE